jgi:hypothetical protein
VDLEPMFGDVDAFGTAIEAPRPVIVPEALITGRRPSRRRMSSFVTAGLKGRG